MGISATIITLDEEKNITACLESLDFADEIIVVDSGSTDRTREFCERFPAVRFFQRDWEGFGCQKNLAASLAAHDWIFNIDADERVTPELRAAIMAADRNAYSAFRVARENYFGQRWIRHCGWYPDYNTRFYDRQRGSFNERQVHEAVKSSGPVGTLSGNLRHFTYGNISDYLRRMDRYSTLAAEEIIRSGRRPTVFSLLLRPIFTFCKMYLLKKGFLEGFYGLLLSALYAIYTFSKYAKALEMMGGRRQ